MNHHSKAKNLWVGKMEAKACSVCQAGIVAVMLP